MFTLEIMNKLSLCILKIATTGSSINILTKFRHNLLPKRSFRDWNSNAVCAKIFCWKIKIFIMKNKLDFWKFTNTKKLKEVKFTPLETKKTKTCTVRCQLQAKQVLIQCQLLLEWEKRKKRKETSWQEMSRRDQFLKRSIFWHFWTTLNPELKRTSRTQNFLFSI